MSLNSDRDVRSVLAREKYFSLRPQPLERWLWGQGVPQAAERVFWMHWEVGMRRGDWCSELSLKQVARECAVDTSTVTRAYQVLKRLQLIRREEPGRDPNNPFRQAIAITEVRLPRELVANLNRFPHRARIPAERPAGQIAMSEARLPDPEDRESPTPQPIEPPRLSRNESQALMHKLSEQERVEFHRASRDRRTTLTFDENTALTLGERGRVLMILTGVSTAMPALIGTIAPPKPPEMSKIRKLSPLEAARVRAGVQQVSANADAAELFQQVLWSIERGALRRFEARLALNIALKKIRMGEWTRPHRLPPNWLAGARTEACSPA